ncbi:DUF58 domain-containing protein [Ruania alba]|uniref:Uncharacterized conserved protein, DUF58 family, contains vWF domain n=1 Tax=Ruania alba TaxID=648782 RepID=A0A1H5NBB5_9MICO|nr:DUF58 domain-containing protein [Ruania alba]SEE98856.1 Uncharacterized conserved protein, DUF58 family, contains vWF domain [Ruania alba]
MAITGRAVLLVALGVVPVLLVPEVTTVVAWAVAVALVLTADTLLAASPTAIEVERATAGAVRRGERAESTLTLTNTGRRGLRGVVRDAWQPTAGADNNRHRLRITVDEAQRVRTTLRPRRRGDLYADQVTIRAYGPLGLAARQASREVPGVIRVLPEFSSRRHLPSRLARLREMDGRTAVNVRGQGTEFDSLREYVVGDDVRAIDWRATARRQEVVVRTWRPERDRRVLLVLDLSRLSAARLGEAPRLDAGIETCLLMAALATKAGDRVDLIAVDDGVRARVRGTHGAAVMPAMADGLSQVTPALVEPDWPQITQAVRDTLSQRALVVVITGLEAGAAESGLLPTVATIARDHQVIVASATDPDAAALLLSRETSADVFDAAAAERGDLERDALAGRLRRTGAEVVERDPESLPPGVADTYLALKAAGRL